MKDRLRILHLEDEPDYSRYVQDILRGEGIEPDLKLVADREEFQRALAAEVFDIILADYSLPTTTGVEALKIAKDRAPETPFLLVSGTVGERVAIESLQAGATDYVLKQWPDRLVPAVRRAINEASERVRRKHAETELIRREKYFRTLTHNALDVLSVVSRDLIFLYNSPSITKVLGYDAEQLSGKSIFDYVHSDDAAALREAFAQCLSNADSTVTREFRARHSDGRWIYLEAVAQSRLADPDIGAFVVNSRDISKRKRIEFQRDALSNLGRKLSSVSTANEAARIIHEAADELFGWDVFMLDLYLEDTEEIQPVLNVDTINGRRVELKTGSPTHKPSSLAQRVIRNGAELILREAQPTTMLPDAMPIGDKSRPSASLMLAPIRNRTRVIGVLSIHSYTPNAYTQSDLDTMQVLADYCGGAIERIRAEQAYRESEQRFRELFENSPEAILVEDFEGKILSANAAAGKLLRLSPNDLVGKKLSSFAPADRQEMLEADFQKLATDVTRLETECWSSDGRMTPVEIYAGKIAYRGQPALLLHARDISERLRAESALRSSEMLFHSVWENSVDGMRLTDENGMIVAVNDAFCELVGLEAVELQGRPFTVIYAPTEPTDHILARYRERFRDRVIERRIERQLTLHNGNSIVLENTNSFVELRGQSPLLLGLFRDITAQKRLEEQLRHSQKMDAIGQLAGGVAHDFNNILTVIHGHASLLLAAAGLTGLAAKSAQQIVHAAERAAGLTRQLLAFSRRQVMQLRDLDLNDVVSDMTKMLERILGEDISLKVHRCPVPATVHADASMMEQIVLNLAVNARDAMRKGGCLTISITLKDVDRAHVSRHSEARLGRFVCLNTADTGCGIEPQVLRRIFEPFFTTKETGKGTGLGLATTYGVVKQHEGWIEVESEVNKGTTFQVYLPYKAVRVGGDEEKSGTTVVRGGTETILVVEDEGPVRDLVSRILQGYGYHVLEAESGAQALEVWRENRGKIHLLLTDVVMPGQMNGRELAEKIWVEQPGLRVIFTSGYSTEIVGKEFENRNGSDYLQKPYEPQKLAKMVRDSLDASPMGKTPGQPVQA